MAITRRITAKRTIEDAVALRRSNRLAASKTTTQFGVGKNSSSTVPFKTAIAKKKKKKLNAAKKKSGNKVVYRDDEEDVGAEKPLPLFETFKSDIRLQEGLSIVRDLGDGKYEIVNVSVGDWPRFGALAVGLEIKSVPARLAMMNSLDAENWNAAKDKCLQAARSANLEIFRLQSLPLELRLKIYEHALISPIRLCPKFPNEHMGFALLETCKQIYDEGRKFFWKNVFNLTDCIRVNEGYLGMIGANLTVAEFDWWGFAIKDPHSLRIIGGLPKLKVLTIVLTQYCVNGHLSDHKRQHKYQDEVSITKFNKTNGFDAMVDIRGLARVIVKNKDGKAPDYAPPAKATDAEIAIFEAFLNKLLTQPRIYYLMPRTNRVIISEKYSYSPDDAADDGDYTN